MIYPLLALVFLFIVGIFVKKFFSKLCAICFSVSATWLIGLGYMVFYNSTEIINTTALGILMGGSAVGGMYFIFQHDNTIKWEVFKFPYLSTAFAIIYFVLTWSIESIILIFLGALWIIFFLIYFLRDRQSSNWFKKIVECCKNW